MTRSRFTGILFVSLFLIASTAGAQTALRTFVSTDGFDSNAASLCPRNAPCRNFSAAIGVTSPGGEVVAINTGGYGPVIVNQPVTIIGQPGEHVAIAPVSGTAISVTAGGNVIIRNLYLNSQGALTGINGTSASVVLTVENCVINGFETGLRIGSGELHADRVTTMNGALVNGPAPVAGIVVAGGRATVTNSKSMNNYSGMWVASSGRMTVVDSVVSSNDYGFTVTGGEMTVARGISTYNSYGLYTSGTSLLRIYDSVITDNSQGILNSGGTISSGGLNTLEGNGSANTFATQYFTK